MREENLHAGHRERMRVRFFENGFENYSPHEVLEQVLFLTIPRANTNETAHSLLQKFGSLTGVLNASPESLTEVPGIGPRAAEFLASIRGMFLESVEALYRETGRFDLYELAFLADLALDPGCGDEIFVAVFDEEQKFHHTGCARTAYRFSGTIDCGETAKRIAEIAGERECIAVTADPDLLDKDHAAVLMRSVHGRGCPLRQLLLTNDAALYDLMA